MTKELKSKSINFCIYCDISGDSATLTNEHAIPYGLNGWLVLAKASCLRCATITGRIEQRSLRGLLMEARTHLNMKTKRPKERPTTFPVYLLPPAEKQRIDLPLCENPLLLRLPNLAEPPILTGETGSNWVKHIAPPFWTFVGVNNERQRENFERYQKRWRYAPTQFALFLAKIAHCCAIAEKGYGRFQPFLPDLIINESLTVSDYVGGCPKPLSVDRNTSLHVTVRTEPNYVIVEMSLFAHLGAPYYQVIVGEPKAK